MITPTRDNDRPNGRPTLPENLVTSVARRSNLDTASTRDMLTDLFGALDVADLLDDVDAPVPFTIVPGVIA